MNTKATTRHEAQRLYLQRLNLHRRYVLLEAYRIGGILALGTGLTHDLSKYRRDEFLAYAYHWNLKEELQTKADKRAYGQAVQLHYARNRHHYQYWQDRGRVPIRYVYEMAADWRAMAREKGQHTGQWYLANYASLPIHMGAHVLLQKFMGVQIFDFPLRSVDLWTDDRESFIAAGYKWRLLFFDDDSIVGGRLLQGADYERYQK
jgi:hypothetical protein